MLDYQDMLVTLGKYAKFNHFIKTMVNGGIPPKINDLVVFNHFERSDYQLPQHLKLLVSSPYVMRVKRGT